MKIKLLIISAFALVAFTAVALVHVYAYTSAKEGEYVNTQVQLGRIDYERALNQTELTSLQKTLRQFPEVQQSQLSEKRDALVYSYRTETARISELKSALCSCTGVKASVYVPTQTALASSCPAGLSSNSTFHSIGRWLHKQLD